MIGRSVSQQLDDLDRRKYSSVELTQAYLERVEKYQSLNAFISVSEHSLANARKADALRASGEKKALLGIPIAHKDIFCEAGVKTTAGSRMLDGFISPYDSTVVSLLKDAGVVSLGKTNMDEFAMGSSNETSYYGPVKNPWQVERVPGGSSGGSAAATAATGNARRRTEARSHRSNGRWTRTAGWWRWIGRLRPRAGYGSGCEQW